jgi:SAM-dependent methyltransferase
MKQQLENLARRSPRVRSLARSARDVEERLKATRAAVAFLRGKASYSVFPPRLAIRLAYNVLLNRDPDPHGSDTFVGWINHSVMSTRGMVATILGSDEFALTAFEELGPSLHFARGAFVRSLPPARRILDLGGSSSYNAAGALVSFGYPYPFEELVIVELPVDERHEHYRNVIEGEVLETHLGPVTFRYHSMTDLSGIPDSSFDLIYSGQSIEHVSEADADKVLLEAYRVLRPGGTLALDTPNGAVCRVQQSEFIDPDHEIEYTHPQMVRKIRDAGFRILRHHGLNYAGESVAAGKFDMKNTARHWGMFDDIEECYLLAYVCVRDD